MRISDRKIKQAKTTAVNAIKNIIDYKQLTMQESMMLNTRFETAINQLLTKLPTILIKTN